jgi:hypothetical protein
MYMGLGLDRLGRRYRSTQRTGEQRAKVVREIVTSSPVGK